MTLLSGVGALLYVVGWLWTVVIAFKESGGWALATLFIPIAWVYYLVSRWRDTWPCIILAVVGAVMFFAAGGTL